MEAKSHDLRLTAARLFRQGRGSPVAELAGSKGDPNGSEVVLERSGGTRQRVKSSPPAPHTVSAAASPTVGLESRAERTNRLKSELARTLGIPRTALELDEAQRGPGNT